MSPDQSTDRRANLMNGFLRIEKYLFPFFIGILLLRLMFPGLRLSVPTIMLAVILAVISVFRAQVNLPGDAMMRFSRKLRRFVLALGYLALLFRFQGWEEDSFAFAFLLTGVALSSFYFTVGRKAWRSEPAFERTSFIIVFVFVALVEVGSRL